MTIVLSTGYLILYNLKKNTLFNKKTTSIFVAEILGFLTIFLSPASRLRATTTKTIFNYPILKLIYENFDDFSITIIGENSIALIVGLLVITISALALQNKSLNKFLKLGLPLAGLIFIPYMFGFYNTMLSVITVLFIIFYIVFAIIELFKFENYRILSIFLFAASCCQGVSFALGEVSYRTLFFLTILFIICTSCMLTKIISSTNNYKYFKAFAIILLFCNVINMLQIFFGYYDNYLINLSTLQSIKNYERSGIIEINTNVDKKYSHIMGYENGAFEDYYFKYHNIYEYKEDIFFIGDTNSNISINGKRIKYPAVYEENTIFIPFRFVIEALGGTCEWTEEKTTYTLDNWFMTLSNSTKSVLESSNMDLLGDDMSPHIRNHFGRMYINSNVLSELTDKYLIELN